MYVPIFTVIFLLILFLLLHFHVKNPDNIYFVVAREWQTVIAALIGFVSLGSIYILTNIYNQNLKHKQATDREIAYISLVVDDYRRLLDDVEMRNGYIEEVTKKPDALACHNILILFRNSPLEDFLDDQYLATQIEFIAPATMKLITDSKYTRDEYNEIVSSFTTEDCALRPDKTVSLLSEIHNDTVRTFTSKKVSVEAYRELLIYVSKHGHDSKYQKEKYDYLN